MYQGCWEEIVRLALDDPPDISQDIPMEFHHSCWLKPFNPSIFWGFGSWGFDMDLVTNEEGNQIPEAWIVWRDQNLPGLVSYEILSV